MSALCHKRTRAPQQFRRWAHPARVASKSLKPDEHLSRNDQGGRRDASDPQRLFEDEDRNNDAEQKLDSVPCMLGGNLIVFPGPQITASVRVLRRLAEAGRATAGLTRQPLRPVESRRRDRRHLLLRRTALALSRPRQ
jgi:hypothetical protein